MQIIIILYFRGSDYTTITAINAKYLLRTINIEIFS